MKKIYPQEVTLEHLSAFGAIVHIYAKIEMQMAGAAAGMIGADLATGLILLSEMGFRQKMQTVRHLNTTIGINGQRNDELEALLVRAKEHSGVRNWIAHSVWRGGKRPGSIKPMQLVVRSPKLTPLGSDEGERDFTAKDLMRIANQLGEVNSDFAQFIRDSGLESRILPWMPSKSDDANASNSQSDGNPNSK